jgi:hypothetical protein
MANSPGYEQFDRGRFSEKVSSLERSGARIGVVGAAPRVCYRAFARQVSSPTKGAPEIYALAGDEAECESWMDRRASLTDASRKAIRYDRTHRVSAAEDVPVNVRDEGSSERFEAVDSADEFLSSTRTALEHLIEESYNSPKMIMYSLPVLANEIGWDPVCEFIIDGGHRLKEHNGVGVYCVDRGLKNDSVKEIKHLFDALVVLRQQDTVGESAVYQKWFISEERESKRQNIASPWLPVSEGEML